MREILFRGKRVDNSAWVYGCLLNNTYGASKPVIISDSSYTDNNRIVNDDWEFVIPETVGQYTGLTDKNGKKIFEGDILKGMGGLHRVYFDTSLACFEWAKINDNWKESFIDFADECEVIGNIYDNSELLERSRG